MKKIALIALSALTLTIFCFAKASEGALPVCLAMRKLGLESGECVYELYLYKKSSGCEILSFAAENEVDLFKALRGNVCSVSGERLFFSNRALAEQNYSFGKIIEFFVSELRAEEVFCEQGDGFYNKYYYSPRIKNYVTVGSKRVNLQISQTEAGVSAASPLAFGSY